jgi:diketogulonate reductase-like aldo/keto reductase
MKKCFLSMALALFGSIALVNAQDKKVNVPVLILNNGLEMPRFGLGTFMASNDDCKQACLVAFRAGYRHVDCAHVYGNERGLGEAVRESGIPRAELWITSKLWPSEYGEGTTLEAIDKMLARLQMDYVDLLTCTSRWATSPARGRIWKKRWRRGKSARWASGLLLTATRRSMPLSTA